MKFSVKLRLFLLVLIVVSSVSLVASIFYREDIFLNENLIAGIGLLLLISIVATYLIYQYFKRLLNSAAQFIAKNNMDDPSVASEEIFDKMRSLISVLYKMLDAGYLVTENRRKIDDWIITFQEPILDIFIRYHRLETSAPDMSTTDEFLINPEFRKTICIMLMKIVANFIVNNEVVEPKDLENFDSWENEELWYSLREILENDF